MVCPIDDDGRFTDEAVGLCCCLGVRLGFRVFVQCCHASTGQTQHRTRLKISDYLPAALTCRKLKSSRRVTRVPGSEFRVAASAAVEALGPAGGLNHVHD